MFRRTAFFVFCVSVLAAGTAAAQPLVDAAWIRENLFSDRLRILDVRSEREYQRVHIAGAVHARYPGRWRVPGRDRIPRLPSPEAFAILAGNLGIGNRHHVVLVSRGESVGDIAVAAQLYWTFKAMGHDAVSILGGGMKAYLADSSTPRTNGRTVRPPQQFAVNFRPQLVANAAHVRALLQH
ncbi:MAG: rhodanese-like domain-containing protein, partial [Rhodospirillales bacterium]